MTLSIENKVNAFYEDAKESANEIIAGSDEHLDLILGLTKPLDELTDKFKQLNSVLHDDLKNHSKDEISALLPQLKNINRICMTIVGALRTSYLYRDVRNCLKKFSREHDLLRELIYDIQHVILADDEFDNLINEINNL